MQTFSPKHRPRRYSGLDYEIRPLPAIFNARHDTFDSELQGGEIAGVKAIPSPYWMEKEEG